MSKTEPQDIYEVNEYKKAPSTSDFELEGPKVPVGKVVKLEYFYIKDETTAAKTMRLGINTAGKKTYLKEEPAATNAHGISQDGKTILVAGEAPIGMVESPGSGDMCRLVARGVYI